MDNQIHEYKPDDLLSILPVWQFKLETLSRSDLPYYHAYHIPNEPIVLRSRMSEPPCPRINIGLEASVDSIDIDDPTLHHDQLISEVIKRFKVHSVDAAWVEYNLNLIMTKGTVIPNATGLFFSKNVSSYAIALSLDEGSGNIKIYATGLPIIGYTYVREKIYYVHSYTRQALSIPTFARARQLRIGIKRGFEEDFASRTGRILMSIFEDVSERRDHVLFDSKLDEG